jgi:CarD family transcriptional regulator
MYFSQFQIGDKVVYPNQGVGIVEQISTRNLTGQPEMFYLLKLGSTSMRVMVPLGSVANVGLRRVTKTSEIGNIFEYLIKGRCKSAADWKGRFKENSEKMRSGSLMQVAEVLKTLIILNQAKPLSFREKKMLDRSWQLLVDEIAVARGQAKEAVEALLVKSLSKVNLKAPLPS